MFLDAEIARNQAVQLTDAAFDVEGAIALGAEEMMMVIEVRPLIADRTGLKLDRNQLTGVDAPFEGSIDRRETDPRTLRAELIPQFVRGHRTARVGQGFKD